MKVIKDILANDSMTLTYIADLIKYLPQKEINRLSTNWEYFKAERAKHQGKILMSIEKNDKVIALDRRANDTQTTQRIYNINYICPTINTFTRPKLMIEPGKIRLLSLLEETRVMGFNDDDYYKLSAVLKDNSLHKALGNSIVPNVLEHLIGEMSKK